MIMNQRIIDARTKFSLLISAAYYNDEETLINAINETSDEELILVLTGALCALTELIDIMADQSETPGEEWLQAICNKFTGADV